jgi:arylsulfatase A-like enzyme
MSHKGNGKNVIWFFVDQMRSDVISFNGDPNVRTPNIDTLAAQGVNFRNAVSGTPLCSPYRGSLLTGLYPHKSSVPGHDYSLDPDKNTVADVFNDAEYDTLYYGKWHLDGHKNREGLDVDPKHQQVPRERRGKFKTWIGYENNNSQFDCYVHGHDNDEEVAMHRLKKFETDALTDMVIDKINFYGDQRRKQQDQPFFMVLSAQPPHDPYTAPAEYMGKYNGETLKLRPNVPDYKQVHEQARRELAGYYALIENIDWNLGRVREALRENELDLDTHIIFFSDHGDMHGSHGMFRKTNPYEESIRVPFIIGGEVPMGYYGRGCKISDCLVNHVDVAPTTLGLCGLDVPDWMAGFDYSFERYPQRQHGDVPESAFLQSVVPTRHDNSIDKPYRGIVTKDGWKYVCLDNSEWLLFNLNEDPYELVNLAHNSVYIEKRVVLNQMLRDWVTNTGDQFNIPELEYTTFGE